MTQIALRVQIDCSGVKRLFWANSNRASISTIDNDICECVTVNIVSSKLKIYFVLYVHASQLYRRAVPFFVDKCTLLH